MKRLFMPVLTSAMVFAGCQVNDITSPLLEDNMLYASIEETAFTRTSMDLDNNVRWCEGDQIVAFMKTSLGLKYEVLSSSAGKTSARFYKVANGGDYLYAGNEWNHNVAYYPYSDDVECRMSNGNYVLDVILPENQAYATESFGNGAMPTVAVSEDNDITFRNICGGLKLQLRGTQMITSVVLEGNNNEILSGAAAITAYTNGGKPSITMASDASRSVTLDCGSGVQLKEGAVTEFILIVPPIVFNKGFKVSVTDSDSEIHIINTNKTNEVKRSSVLSMPDISLNDIPESPTQDEGVYIDEYGINHGQGVEIDGVVWAPVNCGYHETDYPYGKQYQWGRKYGQGYRGAIYDLYGDIIGYMSDATYPSKDDGTIKEGGVSLSVGQSKSNMDVFFLGKSYYDNDWLYPQNDKLWNIGSESNPAKADYDPCPEGWRVSTYNELTDLSKHMSSLRKDESDRVGYWFSGSRAYGTNVPQVFFPATGFHDYYDGEVYGRGRYGSYWSSMPAGGTACCLDFNSDGVSLGTSYRAYGSSVRCVQE